MSKCKIKEFVTQLRGVSYKPTDVTDATNGIPILRANNIQDDGMVYDDLIYVKSEKVKQAQKLQAGDIVICTSSGSKALVGKASIFTGYSKVISFGAFCKALRINDVVGINKDFIRVFFFSKLYREQIASSSIGANINNIKSENIDDLNINIPTPEVQSAAVEILTQLNKAILSKKEQLKQLDELVKSRFIEMFGDVKNNDKNFFVKKGTDLFKFSSGKFLEATKRLESGIPVYGGNGIAWYTSEPLINFDTIVIGRVGAYCGNVRKISGSNWITDNAIYIKEFKEKCFNLEFLEALMGEYDFAQFNDAAAQPKITQKPMENLYYIVPPIELQNTFAEFVKQVDKSKFVNPLSQEFFMRNFYVFIIYHCITKGCINFCMPK